MTMTALLIWILLLCLLFVYDIALSNAKFIAISTLCFTLHLDRDSAGIILFTNLMQDVYRQPTNVFFFFYSASFLHMG
uniref:Putative secreted protein n=1 Tax=Ixodes ricinus TaxID=34613 RepID=A0A147BQV3_IXORI